MADFKDLYQSADWKKEKHAPAIELSGRPGKDQWLSITVSVGKEIPHPNTTVHHISWIEAYFLPKGERFPCQIGRFEFTSHGESVQGADTGTLYTNPEANFKFKTEKPGTVLVSSYCNIHGLWQSSKEVA